ncbi:MAG: hypothetical protein KGO02_00260 [Alphaproteobacteria bacterium]|nr:hypothetical protein [Alphaproteobacteria bacterium]
MRNFRLVITAAALLLAGCSSLSNPFGQPQKPPPAYVVFFPGHSTMLSASAKHIVAAAAEAATQNSNTLVEISGPSTKIAPGYDPRYAQPRINAVIGELLADGVPQNRIAQGSSLSSDLEVDAAGDQRVDLHLVRTSH